MKQIRLKKKMKKSKKCLIFFLSVLFLFFCMFFWLNKKIEPFLENYAELEIKKFANLIINHAVSTEIKKNSQVDQLFTIEKDNDGNIVAMDFNTFFVNQFLSSVMNTIHEELTQIENGEVKEENTELLNRYQKEKLEKGILYEVPIGLFLDFPLWINLLPKVPIKFQFLGDVSSHIHTKITNYGINNAFVEVNIEVEVSMMSMLPFFSQRFTVQSEVPMIMKLVEGTVPNYYFHGFEKDSMNFSLPTG